LITASASCLPEEQQRAAECGSDCFLSKPFTADDVRGALLEARRISSSVVRDQVDTPLTLS